MSSLAAGDLESGPYPPPTKARVVVWGLLAASPFGGMTWQVLHYLVGLRKMGFDTWYVEDRINLVLPTDPWDEEYRFHLNVEFVAKQLEKVGLGDRWVIRDPVDTSQVYGQSERTLVDVYDSAEMFLNITGSYVMGPDQHHLEGLVYIETDPVLNQIWIAEDTRWLIEELDRYEALFTYGENIGQPDCLVPVERFTWHPTRPPVIIDWWSGFSIDHRRLTTVASWAQSEKDVVWQGETYRWSKYDEFQRFIDVPQRSPLPLELCLSKLDDTGKAALLKRGWTISDAADIWDPELYRTFLASSLGEFTVAKDQYVRFRTGWFSDRSVCYLAAGRPVITQETGFSSNIPVGAGLLSFETPAEAVQAIEELADDYDRHAKEAVEIAREYFSYDRVLQPMLTTAGLG